MILCYVFEDPLEKDMGHQKGSPIKLLYLKILTLHVSKNPCFIN